MMIPGSASRTPSSEKEQAALTTTAASTVAATRGPEFFIHRLDKAGTHICIDKRPLTPQLGNVDYRDIILGNGTCRPAEDATTPKPGPQEPAGPIVTRPVPVEGPVTQPAPTPRSRRTTRPEGE